MDAVKEAVLEQKIDDLALRFELLEDRFERVEDRFERVEDRFERAEERNREEHLQIRTEIREVRSGLHGDIHHLNRTMILGFASIAASVIGAVGAAIAANAV